MSRTTSKDGPERYAGFESMPLPVTVRVGGARCRMARLAELKTGEIVPLDRRVGEPLELRSGAVLLGFVQPVAMGDAVAVKLVGLPEDDNATPR